MPIRMAAAVAIKLPKLLTMVTTIGDANANLLPNLPRSGDKRANTSDSFSDESPNKKEKLVFWLF